MTLWEYHLNTLVQLAALQNRTNKQCCCGLHTFIWLSLCWFLFIPHVKQLPLFINIVKCSIPVPSCKQFVTFLDMKWYPLPLILCRPLRACSLIQSLFIPPPKKPQRLHRKHQDKGSCNACEQVISCPPVHLCFRLSRLHVLTFTLCSVYLFSIFRKWVRMIENLMLSCCMAWDSVLELSNLKEERKGKRKKKSSHAFS